MLRVCLVRSVFSIESELRLHEGKKSHKTMSFAKCVVICRTRINWCQWLFLDKCKVARKAGQQAKALGVHSQGISYHCVVSVVKASRIRKPGGFEPRNIALQKEQFVQI